jgi:hypothetical protein
MKHNIWIILLVIIASIIGGCLYHLYLNDTATLRKETVVDVVADTTVTDTSVNATDAEISEFIKTFNATNTDKNCRIIAVNSRHKCSVYANDHGYMSWIDILCVGPVTSTIFDMPDSLTTFRKAAAKVDVREGPNKTIISEGLATYAHGDCK